MYSKSIQTICSGLLSDVEDQEARGILNDNIKDYSGKSLDTKNYDCKIPENSEFPFVSLKEPRVQNNLRRLDTLRFKQLIHIEHQPNGGASVIHAYSNELSHLSPVEMERFAEEFVDLVFSENENSAARSTQQLQTQKSTHPDSQLKTIRGGLGFCDTDQDSRNRGHHQPSAEPHTGRAL